MTALASARIASYADRIRTTLVPAQIAVEQVIARVEYERAEYADLCSRLKVLSQKSGDPETTLMELGSGIWVDAVIPNTSHILLDLGFDLHLELPLAEASEYAEKRASVLENRRRVVMESKREQIQWQIAQFEGAIIEAQFGSSGT